jgi:TatD DNase family protein
MIGTYLPKEKGQVVLHWFTGTNQEARLAVEAGCYFSINIRMLESEHRRRLIASLPPDRVLTETDGPFVRLGDMPAKPRDVVKVITGLGSLWRMDEGTVISTIQKNLTTLLAATEGTD